MKKQFPIVFSLFSSISLSFAVCKISNNAKQNDLLDLQAATTATVTIGDISNHLSSKSEHYPISDELLKHTNKLVVVILITPDKPDI